MDRVPSCLICSLGTDFCTKKNFHDYFKCVSCGFVFLYPIPTLEELNAYYDKEYFESVGSGKRGYDDYKETIIFKRPFYEFLLTRLASFKPATILDVGAAYGDFVQFLMGHGFHAKGVEISAHAATTARERGADVQTSSLEECAGLSGSQKFDIVTLLDVFEHFFDHEAALNSLQTLTANGGHLLIVTPSTDSFTARLLRKHWYQLNSPQHTALFNPANISRLLAAKGFKVLSVEHIKKQFSVRYFLHTLADWLGFKFPAIVYNWGGRKIFSFPFKDNMLVIAKKI